ncbi:MAG: THUMP-like domain-containing protein [Fibrobacterota bacterium]
MFSKEAGEILSEYGTVSDYLKLRKFLSGKYPPEICAAISSQIELRKNAGKKFSHANKMFFDREGLEQSTPEKVAAYNASLFKKEDVVFEICSGIGADTAELSKRVRKVYSVESDQDRIEIAKKNVEAAGCPEKVVFINDKFEEAIIPEGITAFYADPSRREKGKRRIDVFEGQPDLRLIMRRLSGLRGMVKLSPAADYDKIKGWGNIRTVSLDGELKELLFLKDMPGADKTAVVLRENLIKPSLLVSIDKKNKILEISPPLDYIIEPDPAVIRAGLVEELAVLESASLLDNNIAYITSGSPPGSGMYSGVFRVLKVFGYRKKEIRKYLKSCGIEALTVKKRGLDKTPEAVLSELGIKKQDPSKVLVIYRTGAGHTAVLTEKVEL